jgi:hypothetical protein
LGADSVVVAAMSANLMRGGINHELARAQGSLRGEPLVDSTEHIYDYICLGCGFCMCAHEDSDCWRILKSDEDLKRYDEARKVCDDIKYGESRIIVIEADKAGIRGNLCEAKPDYSQAATADGKACVPLQLRG